MTAANRLPAGTTCRSRGWTTSTLLRSKRWRTLVKITQLPEFGDGIQISYIGRSGTQEIMTLPSDVEAAS